MSSTFRYRLLFLLTAILVLASGCDSEALIHPHSYRVQVFDETGSRHAEGWISLRFDPVEELICHEDLCITHDITGRWDWVPEFHSGRSSGELGGRVRSDGLVAIYLDAFRDWTDSGYSLRGTFKAGLDSDFEGVILVTTIGGASPNGHTFIATNVSQMPF